MQDVIDGDIYRDVLQINRRVQPVFNSCLHLFGDGVDRIAILDGDREIDRRSLAQDADC